MLDSALQFVPVFVLVVFRLAGMMLFAPLFGSVRIPKRVRAMLVLVLAFGLAGSVKAPATWPDSTWGLAIGIGGEMVFGLAMGMVMSFVFIAVQWGGEIVGQQMGFNLSEVFDPSFGAQSTIVGDLYYMFTLVVFLVIGGHRWMIRGVRMSFDSLPLLSLGMNQPLLDMLVGLFSAATVLAVQLAAPLLVTMLIVDLVLGLLGRVMPQMNVMSASMSIRAAIGILVVWLGLSLTGDVIRGAIEDSMFRVQHAWTMGR
jgi:flagellar biosynthetic protein FliR